MHFKCLYNQLLCLMCVCVCKGLGTYLHVKGGVLGSGTNGGEPPMGVVGVGGGLEMIGVGGVGMGTSGVGTTGVVGGVPPPEDGGLW